MQRVCQFWRSWLLIASTGCTDLRQHGRIAMLTQSGRRVGSSAAGRASAVGAEDVGSAHWRRPTVSFLFGCRSSRSCVAYSRTLAGRLVPV